MSKKVQKIKWFPVPEEHDYPAAKAYLMLILDEATCDLLVEKLKKAPMVYLKAKDISRASKLPLLDDSNYHVKENQKKIKKGKKMSPILLIRDTQLRIVIIADGYHRLSATYLINEDENIPCVIVSL